MYRRARTRQLRIARPDGSVARFNGFKRDDVSGIGEFITRTFGRDVAQIQPAAAGKSWGELVLGEDAVSLRMGGDGEDGAGRLGLEFELKDVSQVTTRGGDRIEVQFEERPMRGGEEQLTQIQFYVPDEHSADYAGSGAAADESELKMLSTGAGRLRMKIIDAAGIKGVTGEKILQLPAEVGTFMAPRGKFALELYQKYFRMYGTQYDNKIMYDSIVSFFLLENPNGIEQAFVITLKENKKLRMGNQHYQHLVMNCKTNKNINVNIAHTPEQIIKMFGANDKGEPKLEQEYVNVALPKTVATLFRTITNKKVFVAGGSKGFTTLRGASAVHCSLKSSAGLLYPTAKTMVFIHKPTMFIRYEDIAHIEFQRYEGAQGRAHTFDLNVSCRSIGGEPPREYTFKGIDKKEYTFLLAYIHKNRGVDVHNLVQETGGGRGRGRRGMYAEDADAAFAAMGSDAEDAEGSGSDDDSDFNMSEAEGNESENSDSDATGSDDSDGGSDGGSDVEGSSSSSSKKRKRGKENTKKKKKKKAAASPKSKKPKKMPKKDPDAPKKPLSSFMMFGNAERGKIKEENPDIAFGAVGKVLGERWRALDAEAKGEFDELAKAAKAEYAEVYAAYLQSDARKLWEGKMMAEYGQIPGVKTSKKKTSPAKKPKKDKGPKRARSAFMFFNSGERARLKAENPDASFGEMAGIMSKAWGTMTDEQKLPFTEQAEADKIRAKDEKTAWLKKQKEEKEARGEVSSMSEDTSSSDSSGSGSGSDSDGGAAAEQ